jgi:hypothetical protein
MELAETARSLLDKGPQRTVEITPTSFLSEPGQSPGRTGCTVARQTCYHFRAWASLRSRAWPFSDTPSERGHWYVDLVIAS